MQIGRVAAITGVPTKTIRYYEDVGVLPYPERAPNGYRTYGEDTVERLRFVRDAQATGLTLDEITTVFELRRQGEPTCHHVRGLLEDHLAGLDARIGALRKVRRELAVMIERARSLDPSACTDPNRCQSIAAGSPQRAKRRPAPPELHQAPSAHHHHH
jgi:MerR family copper efflux transcriptional regulator